MHNQEKTAKKEGLGRLLQIAGKRRGQLVAACGFSALSSAARLVPYFTIYFSICELLRHWHSPATADTGYLTRLAVITAIAAAVYGACTFTATALSHQAAYNILYELRVQLMQKLARIPSGFFTRTTQGSLKKVIGDDVEQIEEFIAHHITDIAAAVSMPVLTMLYLFVLDWRLAIATLLPIAVSLFLLSSGLKDPRGAQTQVDMAADLERLNGTIVEYVHGMPVVKIFNRTLGAFRRFEEDATRFSDTIARTARFFAPKMGGYYAAFGAQLLLLLPAGTLLALRAESYLDFLPVLLLFFVVGSAVKAPMETMMQMVLSSQRINAGISRIDDILTQPEIAAPKASKTPAGHDITFEDVRFSYDENGAQALRGVSFTLPQGSVTGLVGPSGGGKSTVAQLLLRFYEPQAGTVRIGGVDIREIGQDVLMDMIGYVFQDSFLFHDTVENNIRMGSAAFSREQVERAARAAGIHDVIAALPMGYDTVIGAQGAYLSGGEQQRIAIARVFLKDPPILLLDEATAYADAENESKIQQSFARLARGKTVLMIAHRLKTVQNAHQLLVLREGVLMDCGRHETLLNRCPLYRDMVSANERRDSWVVRQTPHNGPANWAEGGKAHA